MRVASRQRSAASFVSSPALSWRGLVVPVALVGVWAIASARGAANPALLVPLDRLWASAVSVVSTGELPGAILSTITRTLIGWSLGALFGLSLGLVLGLTRFGGRAIAPTFHGMRQIALFAWIPLLSAWFGNGEAMKLALISLSAFFPVLLHVEAGCRDVPQPYREVGRLFGYTRREEILSVILPAATPTIVSGLELAFVSAWIGTIGAEYLIGTGYMNAAADGIGAFLSGARENARMDLVIVGLLTLAVTGFTLNRAVVVLSGKVLAWRTH
jgi:sulfonate transport system permease protein